MIHTLYIFYLYPILSIPLITLYVQASFPFISFSYFIYMGISGNDTSLCNGVGVFMGISKRFGFRFQRSQTTDNQIPDHIALCIFAIALPFYCIQIYFHTGSNGNREPF